MFRGLHQNIIYSRIVNGCTRGTHKIWVMLFLNKLSHCKNVQNDKMYRNCAPNVSNVWNNYLNSIRHRKTNEYHNFLFFAYLQKIVRYNVNMAWLLNSAVPRLGRMEVSVTYKMVGNYVHTQPLFRYIERTGPRNVPKPACKVLLWLAQLDVEHGAIR